MKRKAFLAVISASLCVGIYVLIAHGASGVMQSGKPWYELTSCTTVTSNGDGCYDTDNHTYCMGNGTACTTANPPSGKVLNLLGCLGFSGDTFLCRDEANVLAVRNTTSQETIRIYNTGDASPTHTNYEHMTLTGLAGNSGNVTMQTGGTGGDNLHLVLSGAGTGSVKMRGPSWSRTTTKTVSTTPVTLTAEEICNADILVTTGASVINLPAKAATLDGCRSRFKSKVAVAYSIDPNGTDVIVLNGSALTGGNKITSDGAIDASVTLVYDATDQKFVTDGVSGVFSDGGA